MDSVLYISFPVEKKRAEGGMVDWKEGGGKTQVRITYAYRQMSRDGHLQLPQEARLPIAWGPMDEDASWQFAAQQVADLQPNLGHRYHSDSSTS